MYLKSVLHLLKRTWIMRLSRCSTDLRGNIRNANLIQNKTIRANYLIILIRQNYFFIGQFKIFTWFITYIVRNVSKSETLLLLIFFLFFLRKSIRFMIKINIIQFNKKTGKKLLVKAVFFWLIHLTANGHKSGPKSNLPNK